jgi:hypothetical protein
MSVPERYNFSTKFNVNSILICTVLGSVNTDTQTLLFLVLSNQLVFRCKIRERDWNIAHAMLPA